MWGEWDPPPVRVRPGWIHTTTLPPPMPHLGHDLPGQPLRMPGHPHLRRRAATSNRGTHMRHRPRLQPERLSNLADTETHLGQHHHPQIPRADVVNRYGPTSTTRPRSPPTVRPARAPPAPDGIPGLPESNNCIARAPPRSYPAMHKIFTRDTPQSRRSEHDQQTTSGGLGHDPRTYPSLLPARDTPRI